MNRRKFCLSSIATAMAGGTAGLLSVPAAAGEAAARSPAASAPGIRLYKYIYDRRYAAGRAFGVAAERAGSSAGIAAIGGDVTALWSRELKPLWAAGAASRGAAAIAGMTTARTLFCLEQLALDQWMRVLVRAEHLTEGRDIAHRLTASEPMIARMSPALTVEDWPSRIPALLATCQRADTAAVATRMVGSAYGRARALRDEALVSFVIGGTII